VKGCASGSGSGSGAGGASGPGGASGSGSGSSLGSGAGSSARGAAPTALLAASTARGSDQNCSASVSGVAASSVAGSGFAISASICFVAADRFDVAVRVCFTAGFFVAAELTAAVFVVAGRVGFAAFALFAGFAVDAGFAVFVAAAGFFFAAATVFVAATFFVAFAAFAPFLAADAVAFAVFVAAAGFFFAAATVFVAATFFVAFAAFAPFLAADAVGFFAAGLAATALPFAPAFFLFAIPLCASAPWPRSCASRNFRVASPPGASFAPSEETYSTFFREGKREVAYARAPRMGPPRRPPPRRPHAPSPSVPRQRRALSAPGGPVTADGPPELRRLVAAALDVSPDADARELTHGFHSYPARFHPLLPRRLLDGLRAGATVLDPFVGSGTTTVEAVRAGARALGSDVNPLAVELARLKSSPMSASQIDLLVERAHGVAERSLDRVKRRARTRESGERFDDPRLYMPHVFRELVGLREEIDAEPEPRMPLLLLLSSIVVKLSRQRADTSEATVERAIGKGMPSRLYARKADELGRSLRAFAAAVPPGTPLPDVRLADARKLGFVRDGIVDLIVTSPPYLGTYDYTQQHARRFGWLGLPTEAFEAREIGARRRARTSAEALVTWQADVDAFVAEMARVLRPDGRAFVAIGDSAVGSEVVPGDEAVRRAAAKVGLRLTASAHQSRPSFYAPARRATRREHLLLLQR